MLEIEFDPDKDAWNAVHHDIRLSAARRFDYDGSVIFEDDREDYGETREIANGRLDGVIYTMVFTRRSRRLRVISLRIS